MIMKRNYIFILLALLSCSDDSKKNSVLSEKETEKTCYIENPICLKYDFMGNYPTSMKVTLKNLYVASGTFIYQFNFDGEFMNKFKLPKELEGFVDFNVYESKGALLLFAIWNNNLYCFGINSQIIYVASGVNDFVRLDRFGVAYSNYQEYNTENNQVINKIKVIKQNGAIENFSPVKNLPTLNIEVIDDIILFHASDGKFYMFPLFSDKKECEKKLSSLDGQVWFLGKVRNYYVFKTFDFENKKDVIHFFDSKFDLIKSEILNLSFEDVVKEQRENGDFLMDTPSGVMYAYNNENIYYMRNTKKGTCIYKLKKY